MRRLKAGHAAENTNSRDCVKLLIKDGLTSMEALAVLQKEDTDGKIPRDQYRLILQSENFPHTGVESSCPQSNEKLRIAAGPQQWATGRPSDNSGDTDDDGTTRASRGAEQG